MDRFSFGEALDDYDNKVGQAVEKIMGVDEVEAARILKEIPLDEFLNLTMAIDNKEHDRAYKVLTKYAAKAPSVESIQHDIKTRIAEKKDLLGKKMLLL